MVAQGISDEDDGRLDSALKEFRASALTSAQRPESFWAVQRAAILEGAARHPGAKPWKPLLAWGTLAIVMAAVGSVWLHKPAPESAPDFAAGFDQDLLLDVQRLTSSPTPLALEPALILAGEINAGITPRNSK